MPLWLIGAVAGFLLLKRLTAFAVNKGKALSGSVREQLKSHYLSQMKAKLLGSVLLILCMAALLGVLIWLWLSYVIMPLYTFTDWIPEAFVDPASVLATGKALLTSAAQSTVWRSADGTALEMYSAWISCGCLVLCTGLCVRLLTLRRKNPEKK